MDVSGIPAPPMPELSPAILWGSVLGGIVAGALLLLWGRKLGRGLLTLAGAGAGLVVAPWLAGMISLELLYVRIAAAVTAGLLALVTARLLWGLLLGGLFGAAAGVALMKHYAAEIAEGTRPTFQAAGEAFPDWWAGLCRFAEAYVTVVWRENGEVLLAGAGLACLVPVVVAMIRPRLACIVATSLLGGVLVAGAALLAAGRVRPELWPELWPRFYVPLAIAGGLLLFGLAFQYRGAVRAERGKARVEAEPPNKGKTKKPPPAENS